MARVYGPTTRVRGGLSLLLLPSLIAAIHTTFYRRHSGFWGEIGTGGGGGESVDHGLGGGVGRMEAMVGVWD